jgi:hypothetical protein
VRDLQHFMDDANGVTADRVVAEAVAHHAA